MKQVSLIGTASYLPETVVENAFFQVEGAERGAGMFRGSKERRHVAKGETAASMIEKATRRLSDRLGFQPNRDVDILLTNASCLDMPFTGVGASVAHRLGIKAPWVLDVHNTGCVSFVYMMSIARALMTSSGAKTALICNVQNAAGRVFRHEDNLKRAQSAIPGDGCGVGYLVANGESPVLSVVSHCYPEYADDMSVVSADGGEWWAPRRTPLYIDFTEDRVASIVSRGNQLVPNVVKEACKAAEIGTERIDALVTNQPSHIFLRNWREALQVSKERHIDTFEEHGNLFGAAIPISIERAVETGRLKNGDYLALGGFSHAGDYAAAAIVHWHAS
ncbi:MAG TPA: 3-oxoacyl-[acyl-carrier-protein] synthase III C-terminal domain-containing protein [Labilithrix sp.]|nr:3-oxoacyl-[acyl-carrier-protein] synthase III C-terminal domain-containing protein [Labilithrix sp.]